MASRAVRVGVVGCGAIAVNVHLRVLRRLRGVQVTAVADPSPEARSRALRLVPGAVAVEDVHGVLALHVDAVVVAAPNALHVPVALATLEAGRHLYLEKPVSLTVDDALAVAAAGREAGVAAAVGFNWRFQPLFERAREIVDSGALGRIRSVSTSFCEPGRTASWKASRATGGGVLLDLGSHHFDLVPWLLGLEAGRVDAVIRSDETEHDTAHVRLELGEACVASSFFSFRAAKAHALEVIGERGALRADRVTRTIALRATGVRASSRATRAWQWRALVQRRYEPSWARALEGFVDAVRGERVALPTLEDGARSVELVALAERSAGVA